MQIINVTSENIDQCGVYCIKNKKSPGYQAKLSWFKDKKNEDLTIKIAIGDKNKQLGFIEYTPSEIAWRPVRAKNLLFIHCIGVFAKNARNQSVGSRLVQACEDDALARGKQGICVMTSKGPWIANRSLFERNGFTVAETKGRFELMYKPLTKEAEPPTFYPWEKQLPRYKGWHLLYADQCPWHEITVQAIAEAAVEKRIDLTIHKLATPEKAQKAPSGYGTFSLIRDGRILEDHYISKTRFLNIVKDELKRPE